MINKSNYTLSFTVRASKMNKAGKAPIEGLIAVGASKVQGEFNKKGIKELYSQLVS